MADIKTLKITFLSVVYFSFHFTFVIKFFRVSQSQADRMHAVCALETLPACGSPPHRVPATTLPAPHCAGTLFCLPSLILATQNFTVLQLSFFSHPPSRMFHLSCLPGCNCREGTWGQPFFSPASPAAGGRRPLLLSSVSLVFKRSHSVSSHFQL